MAEIINEPYKEPISDLVPSRRPPTSTGGRPLPTEPTQLDPIRPDGDPGNIEDDDGHGDRGGRNEPVNDGFGVDGVNGSESDPGLSTDLSEKFGEYGSIFADIITQLEDLFGAGRDLIDDVNQNTSGKSVLSSFLNAISAIADKTDGAETTNLTNALTQMMSFYMQQISAQLQNQFNIEQWQIQNEYNSPAEQLKRLSAAGLNPLHFFDNGATGSSTSVTASSGSAPSGGSATGDPNSFDKAMGYIQSALGIAGSVTSAATGGIGLAQAAQTIGQNAVKTANDTARMKQEVKESDSRIAVNNATADNLAQSYAFNEELNPVMLEDALHGVQLKKAAIRTENLKPEEMQKQMEALEAQTAQIYQAIALETGRFLRENKLADANIMEIHSRTKHNYASINKLIAETKGQNSLNAFNDFKYGIERSTGIPFDAPISDRFAVSAMNGTLSVDDFNEYTKFLSEITASQGKAGYYPFLAKGISDTANKWIDKGLYLMRSTNDMMRNGWLDFKKSWIDMDASTRNVKRGLQQNGGVPTYNSWYNMSH